MRNREMKKLLAQAPKLTAAQRLVLLRVLQMPADGAAVVNIVQARLEASPTCPHCQGRRVVRNGQANELQRYKCRGCAKTFNALTGTPLARLRHKAKWSSQAQVLREGLSVHQAAERLDVAASTAFRWRHRFLQRPQHAKARALLGMVEADETYFLRSYKGQQVKGRTRHQRGGSAAKRGLSDEQVPVLVACDQSGSTTDFILAVADKAHELAALAAVARKLDIEHHVLNMSKRQRVQGPWHIQNVNAYHARLKAWMARFNGVATSYLASYLGRFRACDRSALTPGQAASLLALAVHT